eukprot:Nk52_evm9s259 gene=Nk52_evmTU9s259
MDNSDKRGSVEENKTGRGSRLVSKGVYNVYVAQYLLRIGAYKECVKCCDQMLRDEPKDQAAWFLKTHCLVKINGMASNGETSRLEVLEGLSEVGDPLMDTVGELGKEERAMQRKGTDQRPPTASGFLSMSNYDRSTRAGGRSTGTASGGGDRLLPPSTASGGARPIQTSYGGHMRLGTAIGFRTDADGSEHVDIDRIDLGRVCKKAHMAKALFLYTLHCSCNYRKCLELCDAAILNFGHSWWWHFARGVSLFCLDMYGESVKAFGESLKRQQTVDAYVHMAVAAYKLKDIEKCIQCFSLALEDCPENSLAAIGLARVQDQCGQYRKSFVSYKKALNADPSNLEAIASVGAFFFYEGFPELGLRFYRRLLHQGIMNVEILNNLALCCIKAQQLDLGIAFFERALQLCKDNKHLAQVWYNIGHMGIDLGELFFAYQCLKISTLADPNHAEALVALGVLLSLNTDTESASRDSATMFEKASKLAPKLFEAQYNRRF